MTPGEKFIKKSFEMLVDLGTKRTLRRQLELRFGTLPSWVEGGFLQADRAALQRWTDHILTAQSVEEVFAA